MRGSKRRRMGGEEGGVGGGGGRRTRGEDVEEGRRSWGWMQREKERRRGGCNR